VDEKLSFFRGRSATEYAIDTAKGIDEASYLPIGGIERWVRYAAKIEKEIRTVRNRKSLWCGSSDAANRIVYIDRRERGVTLLGFNYKI
jgi:hypothetical protein